MPLPALALGIGANSAIFSADELNRRGPRARNGSKWDAVSVFDMLPRLTQVGPRIFSSEEWQARRKDVSKLA